MEAGPEAIGQAPGSISGPGAASARLWTAASGHIITKRFNGDRTVSFKSEIQIADSWRGNSLRFATKDEAIAHAYNLMMRRFSVRATRVVETDDPINYAYVDGVRAL
jgi:hypothetical protein